MEHCHMFGSELHLKMNVQFWGSLSLKSLLQTAFFGTTKSVFFDQYNVREIITYYSQ